MIFNKAIESMSSIIKVIGVGGEVMPLISCQVGHRRSGLYRV